MSRKLSKKIADGTYFANIIVIIVLFLVFMCCSSWGFYAHKKINRIAIFSLPSEMMPFYKANIAFLEEKAVNPDKRRYILKNEAPRHYIDLDIYGDSAVFKLPRYWNDAVEAFSEDTLNAYGIVPWHINRVYYWLEDAFRKRDVEAILKLSADLGHYIGDANVPLHTTENYNGQMTGQYGIHGFWESRLPELFSKDFDLFVGKVSYIENTQLEAWKAVENAHLALDSVLLFERKLSREFPESKKYSFEERGQSMVRVYAFKYSREYHDLLSGMVERQMRSAIKMTADFWYTAWVNAGQPDLHSISLAKENEEKLPDTGDGNFRDHESGEVVGQK